MARKQISPGKFDRVSKDPRAKQVAFISKKAAYFQVPCLKANRAAKNSHKLYLACMDMGAPGIEGMDWTHFLKYELDNYLYFFSGGIFWRRDLTPISGWAMS